MASGREDRRLPRGRWARAAREPDRAPTKCSGTGPHHVRRNGPRPRAAERAPATGAAATPTGATQRRRRPVLASGRGTGLTGSTWRRADPPAPRGELRRARDRLPGREPRRHQPPPPPAPAAPARL